jgi:hypothetical protein
LQTDLQKNIGYHTKKGGETMGEWIDGFVKAANDVLWGPSEKEDEEEE